MTRTILFVHPSDELYGSDRCLLEIVCGLPETDRVIVALPTDVAYRGALSRELALSGAEVRHVDMLVLRRSLLSPRNLPSLVIRFLKGVIALRRMIREEDVVLVHSNTVAVVSGAGAAAISRKPHLWHVHEHLGDEPRPYRLVIRLMLALAPGMIVANSVSVARVIAGHSRWLAGRIRVVRNAVREDIEPASSSSPEDTERPVIGIVGRLSPRKGVAEAIQAASLLKERGYCFSMRFVGGVVPGQEWRQAEYEALVHAGELEAYVSFCGEREDIAAAYREFDILLLPSQRPEPFGLVVIEGMAAGLPVVATSNGGGSDELLDHGVTGIYCERAPAAIADSLERLLAEPQLRAAIGAAARQAALRHYSIDGYRAAFRRIYERLAGCPVTLNARGSAGRLAAGGEEAMSREGRG